MLTPQLALTLARLRAMRLISAACYATLSPKIEIFGDPEYLYSEKSGAKLQLFLHICKRSGFFFEFYYIMHGVNYGLITESIWTKYGPNTEVSRGYPRPYPYSY